MSKIDDFVSSARDGVFANKQFVKAVQQQPVAEWPIRGLNIPSQAISNVLYRVLYQVATDIDLVVLATQSQAIYQAALDLYDDGNYAEYWIKLRELPLPITWSDDVDLRDAVFQFITRSTNKDHELEIVVSYHNLPGLSHTMVSKIAPDLNCIVAMPAGVGLKLAAKTVHLLLTHAGGDCFFMKQVESSNGCHRRFSLSNICIPASAERGRSKDGRKRAKYLQPGNKLVFS